MTIFDRFSIMGDRENFADDRQFWVVLIFNFHGTCWQSLKTSFFLALLFFFVNYHNGNCFLFEKYSCIISNWICLVFGQCWFFLSIGREGTSVFHFNLWQRGIKHLFFLIYDTKTFWHYFFSRFGSKFGHMNSITSILRSEIYKFLLLF